MPEQFAADLSVLARLFGQESFEPVAVTEGETHRLRWANASFCSLAGAEYAALIGRPLPEVLPTSASRVHAAAMLDRVYSTGKPQTTTVMAPATPRGSAQSLWLCAIAPMFGGSETPIGLLVRVDVTSPRVDGGEHTGAATAAEEVLLANEQLLLSGLRAQELAELAERQTEQLQALLGSLSEGVVVQDTRGHIVLINPAGRAILRLPDGDLGSADDQVLDLRRLDGSPLPPENWPFSRTLRGERFDDDEVLLLQPDGAQRRVVFSGSALADGQGRVLLSMCVFRDVTELRALERTKEEYIGLISHDLRSPLAAVLGSAQLVRRKLRQGHDPSGALQWTDAIIDHARQMDGMIQELLESSRLTSDRVVLHMAPSDLIDLVSKIAERLGSPADRARIRTVVTQPPPPIRCDAERIERVVTNLVTNALKYSPAETPVVIGIGREGPDALVSVADRGSGIQPADLPQLFERFYRTGTAVRTDPGGLGLGLYIARLIVEAHGGRIWAESTVGKGSTFQFTLPARRRHSASRPM
jgi:signal transduction histidine kinase